MALVIVENKLGIINPKSGTPYRNMIVSISLECDMMRETTEYSLSDIKQIERLTHEYYTDLEKARAKGIERLEARTDREKALWREIQELMNFN